MRYHHLKKAPDCMRSIGSEHQPASSDILEEVNLCCGHAVYRSICRPDSKVQIVSGSCLRPTRRKPSYVSGIPLRRLRIQLFGGKCVSSWSIRSSSSASSTGSPSMRFVPTRLFSSPMSSMAMFCRYLAHRFRLQESHTISPLSHPEVRLSALR